jgi:hypothetical protein
MSCGLEGRHTNVSEKHTVSIFRADLKMETVSFSETLVSFHLQGRPEDVDGKFIRNFGTYLRVQTESQPEHQQQMKKESMRGGCSRHGRK